MDKNYLNKWISYPWLKNNNLDYLIHEDDLIHIESLDIVYCIEGADYITVKNQHGICRVKKDGVNKILPLPKFLWGDLVIERMNFEIKGVVVDLFWHHAKEKFNYYITLNGVIKSKRFSEDELEEAS